MTQHLLLENENFDDIKVDLHIHTTASDGTWKPESLVKNILKAGIALFAVTDHDSTENVSETARLAKAYGLRMIAGVEMNTTFNARNYHILGLGIDPENEELQLILKRNRELMNAMDKECIGYLAGKFDQVSEADFRQYRNNPERGGWKALNYLIDKQLCRNHHDFFGLFTEWGDPFAKLVFSSPGAAVQTIRRAGGVPVLAHPGAAFYERDYQALIAALIPEGIGGIECYHPDNSREITAYCLEICASHHLLVTGGSDCHGAFVAGRCLGRPDVRLSEVKLEGIRVLG